MSLTVNEIFASIQGESSHAGRPCVFIRLTGCNLRCSYCDTRYAYEEGTQREIAEIEQAVRSCGYPLVEVTGGEPLLQPETPALVRQLLAGGYTVLLETNGSLDIGAVDARCCRIVDVKCPSSGQAEKNRLENLALVTPNDEVKFVIAERGDFDYARGVIAGRLSGRRDLKPPLFSPVYGRLDPELLARWILAEHLDVRLQIQLHKVLWHPERRGV
ncbi:MAG: radical SAM protein [Syntrophales bacterium]